MTMDALPGLGTLMIQSDKQKYAGEMEIFKYEIFKICF